MAEVLIRTGMRILLAEEMPDPGPELPDDWPEHRPSPEDRAEQAAHERGELIYVGWHVFADLEEDGREYRVGGSWGWQRAIWLDRDPASDLLQIVKDERYHLDSLYGDLRVGDMYITRWEFHAAPFRAELSPKLQERLASAWRGHPPEQPPAHEDFYRDR